ncbi:MAG TPA: glycine cleavage system aminomethyltransferase GcvT [Legionellales bacterium]|nr:glycine cleavage system aminomethyltransferase GcvT [Legionellales bacterium]HCA89017.1 glycine cleavage system aminomethyltransferase GcvT [Legionellales bacterium]|tara:strand:- start:18 stop:1103 length:1086 start_codon:yes stop_codon:yes gene_type:complete
MTQKTALYAKHQAANAQFVDFYGWEMPLHYGSQLQEQHAVREQVGMFDVSHMTIVDIQGTQSEPFLRKLLTNDVALLPDDGRALYTCMCNDQGKILDDLIVYKRAFNHYRLILNSATRAKDLAWLKRISAEFSVNLIEQHDLALLAIQGPKAAETLDTLLPPTQAQAIATLKAFECTDVDDMFFARTGYTGEDGFEIALPKAQVTILWQTLQNAGVMPCGLGARDGLRLEAGLMLYGQDMDETNHPFESALGWVVKLTPDDRDFIGKTALQAFKEPACSAKKLVGLILEGKGMLRHGQTVLTADNQTGIITSGGYSPTLKQSIALARVPFTTQDKVQVLIRNKPMPARVTKPRFVKNGQPI